MFEQGKYPEADLFEHVFRDVSKLFDEAKVVIEDLAKNDIKELIESLNDSIKFLDLEKEQAEKMKPTTLWGRLLKRFINDMIEQVQFILRQNINIAQRKSFVDFSKQDLLSIIELSKKEVVVSMKNMKNDKDALISNNLEAIKLARKFLAETNKLEAKNKISKYFREGVNLVLRKLVAGKTFFMKSAQKE